MRKIALMDRLVFLLFRVDGGGIQRRARRLAVMDLHVPRRVARLLERFGYHDAHWLPPIAYLARGLPRRLVRRALGSAGREPIIIDNRDHSGHFERGIRVDRKHFSACDRGGDQNAFGTVFKLIFCRVKRRPGNFRQALHTRYGLAENALFHRVEAIGRVGPILLEVDLHGVSPLACSRTAWRVRRASGILKSFSP